MSDEPQQPQLRLKPRVKPETDSAQPQAITVAPASNEAPKTAAPAPLAFKLRSPTPPPTADVPPSVASSPHSAPPASLPPSPPHASPEPAAPAPTEDPESLIPAAGNPEGAPRLKLRSKESETSPASPALPVSAMSSSPAVPAETGAVEADTNEAATPARKTFKLSAKPPVTPHPHPEGVPPAFLVETPAAVEVPTPPAPPRHTSEPLRPAPFPEASPAPATSSSPILASAPPVPPPPNKPAPAPLATPPPPARPKVPHFKPSEKLNLPAGKTPGIDAPLPTKGGKRPKLVLALLVLCVAGTGAYFAYDTFFKPAPPPPPPPPSPAANKAPAAAPAANASTPTATSAQPTATAPHPSEPASQKLGSEVESIAHMPAKLIAKAQDSLAARRNIEQERIDNPGNGKDTPEQRGFPLAPPNANRNPQEEPAHSSGPATYSPIAPGISATDSSIKTSGKPASTFRRTVSEFTIRGVFQGNPSRAHINGRIVLAGNVVDPNLGIIFVGVNPDEKMLVFRDASGATVMRRY